MIELTTDQRDATIMLRWLLDGPRASGRSTAIAHYLVEKSIATKKPVQIFTHDELETGHYNETARGYIVHRCMRIVQENFSDYEMTYNKTNKTIEVKHK